ncbi:DBH-like monooxygenase protein 1 homolog isoform X2 [Folsomia candida]|nr:DBH-like monooxygenase protein 1 homolog isoform X2 [Folsomia candida]XP_035707514.1 DBH-like monooxygenase protein 1 homolog isoform X2 [Folsomia candida]
MKSADIVIGGVDSDGKTYFEDRHGIGNVEPVIDVSQDWTLLDAKKSEGVTHLKFSRRLETCDEDDVDIKDETQRLLWAIGESDIVQYHGSVSRGSYSVKLLDPPPFPVDLTKYKSVNILTRAEFPATDSTYWCSVVEGPETLENESPHIIAMGPKLNNELALRHTHHLTLYSCQPPLNNADPQKYFAQFKDGNCFSGGYSDDIGERRFDAYKDCSTIIYSWAIGGNIMIFPENVGLAISTRKGKRREYFLLELHLNNPGLAKGLSFQTGVELFYSEQPRPIEVGLLGFGVVADFRLTIPPDSSNFKVVSHCSPECTKFLPDTGYTLFNVQLHAHNTANKMRVRHFREDVELPFLGDDQNYDNGYQENRNIKEVKLLPGDHLTLECTYDTRGLQPPRVVRGGYRTTDEMCDAIMYPKGRVVGCGSEVVAPMLMNATGIRSVERTGVSNPKIKRPSKFRNLTYAEYLSSHVNWTEDLRLKIQDIQAYTPQLVGCAVQDPAIDLSAALIDPKTKFQVLTQYPKVTTTYQPPSSLDKNCSARREVFISSSSSSSVTKVQMLQIYFIVLTATSVLLFKESCT